MATRFAAVRGGGALKPIDDAGREALLALTPGAPCMVEVTQPRNLRQHRLFFALLRKVHDNLPVEMAARYPTVETLRQAVQFACGLFDECVAIDGTRYYKARSIAFDKMGQEEFGELFRQAVDVIVTYVIEDLDAQALLDEVEEMIS